VAPNLYAIRRAISPIAFENACQFDSTNK